MTRPGDIRLVPRKDGGADLLVRRSTYASLRALLRRGSLGAAVSAQLERQVAREGEMVRILLPKNDPLALDLAYAILARLPGRSSRTPLGRELAQCAQLLYQRQDRLARPSRTCGVSPGDRARDMADRRPQWDAVSADSVTIIGSGRRAIDSSTTSPVLVRSPAAITAHRRPGGSLEWCLARPHIVAAPFLALILWWTYKAACLFACRSPLDSVVMSALAPLMFITGMSVILENLAGPPDRRRRSSTARSSQ